MSPTEAARIAAVLPLPKKRGAVAPKGFTRRYGNTIAARIGVVARDGLDACVYKGATPPVNKAPPPCRRRSGRCPARNMRARKPLPPIENAGERGRRCLRMRLSPRPQPSERAEPESASSRTAAAEPTNTL